MNNSLSEKSIFSTHTGILNEVDNEINKFRSKHIDVVKICLEYSQTKDAFTITFKQNGQTYRSPQYIPDELVDILKLYNQSQYKKLEEIPQITLEHIHTTIDGLEDYTVVGCGNFNKETNTILIFIRNPIDYIGETIEILCSEEIYKSLIMFLPQNIEYTCGFFFNALINMELSLCGILQYSYKLKPTKIVKRSFNNMKPLNNTSTPTNTENVSEAPKNEIKDINSYDVCCSQKEPHNDILEKFETTISQVLTSLVLNLPLEFNNSPQGEEQNDKEIDYNSQNTCCDCDNCIYGGCSIVPSSSEPTNNPSIEKEEEEEDCCNTQYQEFFKKLENPKIKELMDIGQKPLEQKQCWSAEDIHNNIFEILEILNAAGSKKLDPVNDPVNNPVNETIGKRGHLLVYHKNFSDKHWVIFYDSDFTKEKHSLICEEFKNVDNTNLMIRNIISILDGYGYMEFFKTDIELQKAVYIWEHTNQ